MAILTLADTLALIKPHYENQAQLYLQLTELNKEEVQEDTVLDVYVFKNGCIAVTMEAGTDAEYLVVDVHSLKFDQYMEQASMVINLCNVALDVFRHD